MFCVSFEYFTFDFATKNETSINRLLSSHCLHSLLNFLAIILTLHGNFPRKVLEVFFIVSKVSHFGRYIICCTSQWIWTQSMFSKDKEYWLIDSDNKLMALAQSQYHFFIFFGVFFVFATCILSIHKLSQTSWSMKSTGP